MEGGERARMGVSKGCVNGVGGEVDKGSVKGGEGGGGEGSRLLPPECLEKQLQP